MRARKTARDPLPIDELMTPEPSLQPTLHQTTSAEFDAMVDTLIGLLGELDKASRRTAALIRRRFDAAARGDLDTFERCLEIQGEALTDLMMAERERVASLTEIGLSIGHRRPSRLRLAELVLYVSPERRDELLDVRECLRNVADDLDRLDPTAPRFRRSRSDAMSLYVCSDLAGPDFFEAPSHFDTALPTEGVHPDTGSPDDVMGIASGEAPEVGFHDDGPPPGDLGEPTPLELQELDALLQLDKSDVLEVLGPLAELADTADGGEKNTPESGPRGSESGPSSRISKL